MFENIRIDKNYIDKLFDIDGYHYSNYPEFTVDDLILLLDLNPIFISEYSNWYLINGKLYYYKKHGLFNEIFLSEISHEFDLKNIKYNIVKNGDSIGLISESFRKKPYKFYDYDDYFKHKGYKVPRTLTNL